MPNTELPNIVVFWGDDIGITNLSCYSDGVMGYRTPNIDRLADEGMRFTDSYGEQSCTAGRSAFITGQSVYRTGLSKVGIPGAEDGISAEDPTIAELLKPLGYATGQFGKNHLGDRDEHLPTMHGFDEFFGNLYHLNAEEEPEHPDYPDPEHYPEFRERYGPRGVLHSKMTSTGRHTIKDTGPLTKKRMQTIDDEIVDGAIDFIGRKHRARTPFFTWINTTHMHFRTHTKRRSLGQAGRWQSPYHDTMIDHDKHVGKVLDHARQARHRREHDRHVLDRQRPAHELVAGRRHDAVPVREEHELGGRLPRPAASSAGQGGSPPASSQTRSSAISTGCRRSWPPRASPTSSRSWSRDTRRGTRASGSTSTATTCSPISRARSTRAPGRGSSTSRTTATWWRCDTTTGRSSSCSSACRGTLAIWGEPFVATRIPYALQPADRPVRARRRHLQHVLGLVPRASLHAHARTGGRRPSSWARSSTSRRGWRRPASRSTRCRRSSRRRSPAVTDPTPRHGPDSGRRVHDGLGRALSGGGARAPRLGGRVPDGRHRGHERRVRLPSWRRPAT